VDAVAAVVCKHCSGGVCLAISVAAVEAGDQVVAGAVAGSAAAAAVVVVLAEALVAAAILVVAAQEVIGEDLSTGRP
jgi:hypothetical protein